MSEKTKHLLYTLIGALAGLGGFAVVDLVLTIQESMGSYLLFNLILGASFGLLFGVFLGTAEGIIHWNQHKIVTGALVGIVVGALGGILGVYLGQRFLLSLLEGMGETISLWMSLILRAISWAIMGMFIAMVEGIRARSGKKLLYGLLGGLIGGLLGGFLLELLNQLVENHGLARLVGMLLLGSFIGLFYAIMENRFSPGVLRVLNGELKGKKLALNQRKLTIGKAPRNDLAMPNYDIEKLHAVITVRGGTVKVEPLRNSYQLKVNDNATTAQELKYHDVISLGQVKFLYEVK